MKVAISIQDEIFKEVESTAKQLHCSRSEVFSMAVKEFLEKMKSKKLLKALNEAYSEEETPEETGVREAAKKLYARVPKEKY